MNSKDFFAALVSTLETGTGKTWGLGEPPSDTPTLPYGVIMTQRAKTPDSSLNSLVDWIDYRVQLCSVGGTYEQAAWMQQKTLDTIVGDSRAQVTAGGEVITWVVLEENSGVVDSGHSLWQSNDIVTFRAKFS